MNASTTSERGKRGSHVQISNITNELKALRFLSQQQMAAQLPYLLSYGWVAKISDHCAPSTKESAQIPRSQEWQRVTIHGIDRIDESLSAFVRQCPTVDVNIRAVNSGVQIGADNVIKSAFVDLSEELGGLNKTVADWDMADEEKRTLIAETETTNGQSAKPMANESIVKTTAWDSISNNKMAALMQSGSGIPRGIGVIVGSLQVVLAERQE